MSLKLVPPGKRKNKYIVVRGRFLGIDIETSTQTRDPASAERFKNDLERELLDGVIPSANAHVTFHRAADLHARSKNPPLSRFDELAIEALKTAIPDKSVRAMTQADLDGAAQMLYPGLAPETWVRKVYTPARSILRYCADNKWCDYIKIKHPRLKDPETRAAKDDAMEKLLNATTGIRYLLLLWLFRHGTRITGTLSVQCERLDLKRREYSLYISKSKIWRTFPMDDEIHEILCWLEATGKLPKSGKLFPWAGRTGVRVWLHPLTVRLGVKFTPHMARHRLGKKLNDDAAAGLRTIMMALGQRNYRSALRYIAEDIDVTREALGKVSGKRRLKD